MLTITAKDLTAIEAAAATLSAIAARPFAVNVPAVARDNGAALDGIVKRVREFMASPELVGEAREIALRVEDEEDRISLDDDASMSPSDAGTFVSCWIWVPRPEDADDDGSAEESDGQEPARFDPAPGDRAMERARLRASLDKETRR